MTPAKEEIYLFRFQKNYFNLFRDTLKINRFDFNYNTFWIKTIYNQHRMARRREKHDDEGIQVPPVMIFSITNQCNLHCKGCYANAQNRKNGKEISTARMAQIIDEASELGIGIVIIAGGEPMMREEILDMSASHKEIIFPFFTNGLLLDEQKLNFLHQHKNLIPVLIYVALTSANSHQRTRLHPIQRRHPTCLQHRSRQIHQLHKGITFQTGGKLPRPSHYQRNVYGTFIEIRPF